LKQVPKWKFAVMVWIAIFPSITFLQILIGKQLLELPIPLRSLILTVILVPLMVFVLLPILRKFLGSWLNK
jgi:antibiotic biosynthesis monooxygenase (ABM) superfamily enzyme